MIVSNLMLQHKAHFAFNILYFLQAAGKIAKEEGKQDGSAPEDGFPDGLRVPSSSLELVSNTHSSRYQFTFPVTKEA